MTYLPPSCQRTNDFDVARKRLSNFVNRKAQEISRITGINFEESLVAPSTQEEVQAEWNLARKTNRPFRVYSGASDSTIYDYPSTNWSFRFWHDYLHVKHNRGMSFDDELAIAALHIEAVTEEFGHLSLEARIIEADTYGQALYYRMNQEHVANQMLFVKWWVYKGLHFVLATYRKLGEIEWPSFQVNRPVIGTLELGA